MKVRILFLISIWLINFSAFAGQSLLLRGTMSISPSGHLCIGGCDACELSQLSPYPIYVLDEALVRKNMQEYVNTLSESYPNPGFVYYASKAMMNSALCAIAEQESMGLDVSSGGELFTAISAGFPMGQVILHGNNKSDEELKMALEHGVGRIALDNLDEARLLSALAVELEVRADVVVRVKPGVHADTHHYIVTGTEDSKFGFNILDGSAALAIEELLKLPGIAFRGIHCHIGSQILNLEGFEKAIEVLADFCDDLNEKGIAVEELDFGGGLGAVYTSHDTKVAIEDYVRMISLKIVDEFSKRGLTLPTLTLEPGRSIIAEAGTTLYRIGSTKEMPSGLLYAAVNGGMADNIRPALYGAKYHAVLANRAQEKGTTKVKIVGKCCESGDILIQEIFLPCPKEGDVLAVFTTGAYNYSMASNYNRLPVPGILLVKEGQYDWIVIPQDYADIMRNDRIPLRLQSNLSESS